MDKTVGSREGLQNENLERAAAATIGGIRYSILGSRDLAAWTSELEEVTPAVPGSAGTPDTGWTLRSFRLKSAPGASGQGGFPKLQVTETP